MTLLTFCGADCMQLLGSQPGTYFAGVMAAVFASLAGYQAIKARGWRKRADWAILTAPMAAASWAIITVAARGGVNRVFGIDLEMMRYLS